MANNPNDLARMVPGFEFLQNLMKSATAGMPGVPGLPSMGQWIAPTLDPKELDKRIQELKTVQFWLDSNVKLLATTIQALEVQRMTLSTLQTMNLPLVDLRDALKINVPSFAPAPSAAPAPATPFAPAPDAAAAEPADKGKPAIDPLQWWGALTQQFTELATQAMKDSGAGAGLARKPAARKKAAAARPAKPARKPG